LIHFYDISGIIGEASAIKINFTYGINKPPALNIGVATVSIMLKFYFYNCLRFSVPGVAGYRRGPPIIDVLQSCKYKGIK
jgi:hypothetical protein